MEAREIAPQSSNSPRDSCAKASYSFDEESGSLLSNESEGYWVPHKGRPTDLDEDVYALAISDLTRDFERLDSGNQAFCVMFTRITTDFILLVGCIAVQIFLLGEIKKFVTARAVHDIRISYGSYELMMYGNDTSHCIMTVNGFCRGIHQYFNASNFELLDESLKAEACKIPLSQPLFFGIILWLWTTTCMGQLMKLSRQFKCLILRTETAESSRYVHEPVDGEPLPAQDAQQIIYQLTRSVKAFFVTFVFVPRVCIILYLTWLGCRWLLATNNFGDLILNAVALEFILQLGEVIYVAMVPERNKHDLGLTKLLPPQREYEVGYNQLIYLLSFNFVTMAWVYLYMTRFQMVLPGYRWDVHDVCKSWIAVRFAV